MPISGTTQPATVSVDVSGGLRARRNYELGLARTSTKPAAAKSPSNASASRIRRARINAKLVASTYEYLRSS